MGTSGKKKKKGRPDPAGDLSESEQERLLTILDGVETASHRTGCDDFCAGVIEAALAGGQLALALAHRLGGLATPLSVTILSEIMDRHPDRKVIKEAKRSLFRLKGRGLEVPEAGPAPAALPVRTPAAGFVEAWAGVFDAMGRRLVTGAVKAPGGGLVTCAVVMSYEQGLVDWQTRALSAKKWREFTAMVKEDADWPLVGLEAGHLKLLLEEARAAAEAVDQPPPQSFFDFLSLLPEDPAPRPPVYDLLDGKDVAGDEQARRRAERLPDDPLLAAWTLPDEDLALTVDRIRTALGGTLVVSQAQRVEWVDKILAEDLDQIFDSSRRRCYARRLEETAFILGKENRTDDARSALAAALEAGGAESLAGSPFFQVLLEKCVRRHLPELEQEEPRPAAEPDRTESGLIIPGGAK